MKTKLDHIWIVTHPDYGVTRALCSTKRKALEAREKLRKNWRRDFGRLLGVTFSPPKYRINKHILDEEVQ